jgi:hypothetical protein
MVERQIHGKRYEKMIAKILGLTKKEYESISYTNSIDIPLHLNRKTNKNVSVKSTKSNTVCMANPLHVYDHSESSNSYDLITCIYDIEGSLDILYLRLNNYRKFLFGEVSKNDIHELTKLIKSVEYGRRQTPEERKLIQDKKNELNLKSGIIKFNPKIDSKKQRRLQCSFNINECLTNIDKRRVFLKTF